MQAQTLDAYWRLKGLAKYGGDTNYKKILEDAGYIVGRRRAPTTYREWLHRIEVGLVCYQKCSTDELRKFVTDRRLHDRPHKLKRDGLYIKLMNADRHLTFHRFKDLPPELRNIITELYMAEFSTLTTPSQPPITRVSRQIRQEYLSTFYACCSFRIELRFVWGSNGKRLVFPDTTTSFLNALALRPDNASHLSDLTIDLKSLKTKNTLGVVRILKDKKGEYNVTWTSANPPGWWMHHLLQKLDAMFAEQKKLSVGKKLEIKDIWALRVKMEDAWKPL